MRLNRYLASCGVASRRKCDQMIEEGKVTLNGSPATLGSIVKPGVDSVLVNGKPVEMEQKAYFIFYKPLNVLTTLNDPHGRRTIVDYLVEIELRLFPVGRLDYDSEGLLLLTNDGALAHRTQHPKYEIEKEKCCSCINIIEVNGFSIIDGTSFCRNISTKFSVKQNSLCFS